MEASNLANNLAGGLEYYGGMLCIRASALVDGGLMSESAYKSLAHRGRMTVLRRGGGAKGQCALISVDSLPERYKSKVLSMYPGDGRVRLAGWVRKNYVVDQGAVVYFSSPSRCGFSLPAERMREYIVNASVLNCCIKLYERASDVHRLFGGRYDWGMMSEAIESLREQYGHTLPSSTLRFRSKVNMYKREGYGCLVSGKFGNQSARKVDQKTERLIVSLACRGNQPFNTDVSRMYNEFVSGRLEVFDVSSGELFVPGDFVDGSGSPLLLSEATIQSYLSKPKNRVLISHATMSGTTFLHAEAPHVHRHAPCFSFSRVSFDDRDLPRKLKDTKLRPKAYYAYDVASQCVVGVSYNRGKTVDLVVGCFRSMFQLIEREGWCCPAEVEVENHLMSQWRDSFLKAGEVFPFVRFCAPQNSQEKYAEQLNGAKKKSVEHRNHLGVGRFYAKDRHWRTESKKVSDSSNELWEDRAYYTWDELIADDERDVWEFNHSLHPDQKRYPGMTRWEVLVSNMNPTLQRMDRRVVARYIGEHVETSVRRNSYCRVLGKDWWLSRTEVLDDLEPNNYSVDAYWLPGEDGLVKEVYIYQGGKYVDTLEDLGTFNSASAEQTDADRAIFVAQQKKISHFKGYVKERAVSAVGVLEKVEADASPTVAAGAIGEAEPRRTVAGACPSERLVDGCDEVSTDGTEGGGSVERVDYARLALEEY